MSDSPILQIVFHSGTLTVRGGSSVGVGDNFSQYGRPYMFTADGLLVERHELVSVIVLSDADLRAQGLDSLRVTGDQNWRAVSRDGA